MFDFKYKESVDACWELLECTPIPVKDTSSIPTLYTDHNIDLMPCVGIFQEIFYFRQFNYYKAIEQYRSTVSDNWSIVDEILRLPEPKSMVRKTLYITAALTLHMRYVTQVVESFITDDAMISLRQRLAEEVSADELVQLPCHIDHPKFKAQGLCDVLCNDIIYELKFVKELTHEHYLQLACYMIALNKETGILWNTRTNEKVEVKISDRPTFLNLVARTVNKD